METISKINFENIFLLENDLSSVKAKAHHLRLKMFEATNYVNGVRFEKLDSLLETIPEFADVRITESKDIYYSMEELDETHTIRIRQYLSSNSTDDTVDIIFCDNHVEDDTEENFVEQEIQVQYFTEVDDPIELIELVKQNFLLKGWKPTYSIKKRRKRWTVKSDDNVVDSNRAICVIDQILEVKNVNTGEVMSNSFDSDVVLEFEVDKFSFPIYHKQLSVVKKLINNNGGTLIPKIERKITTLNEKFGR